MVERKTKTKPKHHSRAGAQRATELRNRVAKNIRAARKAAGFTLVEAGEAMGMKHPHLCRIELAKGFPSAETLVALARAYHVDVADFFLVT